MRCSPPQNPPIDGCASPSSLVSFSPEWASEGAETDVFEIQYGPGRGTPAKLPMSWDRMYLARWFTFVRQVAERYGNSPAFRVIGAAGPTSVSDEMTMPGSPPAIR